MSQYVVTVTYINGPIATKFYECNSQMELYKKVHELKGAAEVSKIETYLCMGTIEKQVNWKETEHAVQAVETNAPSNEKGTSGNSGLVPSGS